MLKYAIELCEETADKRERNRILKAKKKEIPGREKHSA